MKKLFQLLKLQGLFLFCCFFFSMHISAQDSIADQSSAVNIQDENNLQWGPCPEFMPEGCNLTILHGDPAEKNADVLLKLPANTSIANHKHTSAERMILLSGEMEVSYEGEQPQTLTTGSYAYGPANKPHTARCIQGPCILFIAFEEPVDAIAITEKN